MTRYIDNSNVTLGATARPLGDGRTYDGSYHHSKHNPHGHGYCKTPHLVPRETVLYNGYCPLCVANGAGDEA